MYYYTIKCDACNAYIENENHLDRHRKSINHYKNVVDKYPECLKDSHTMINGKHLIDKPKLNMMKENIYIKYLK
jgi:hypothetical protein